MRSAYLIYAKRLWTNYTLLAAKVPLGYRSLALTSNICDVQYLPFNT